MDREDVLVGLEKIDIGFVIHPNFNALDLVGPHEVLSRLHSRCLLISEKVGTVLSEQGIAVKMDVGFLDCPSLDIVVVTGGPGQSDMMKHSGLMTFLKNQPRHCPICGWSLYWYPSAGRCRVFTRAPRATTHWLAREELVKYGTIPVRERVVWDGKFITGAGVSAGIDLALALAGKIAGSETAQLIQLAIEYDPSPPFDSGSPEKASSFIVDQLKKASRFHKGV